MFKERNFAKFPSLVTLYTESPGKVLQNVIELNLSLGAKGPWYYGSVGENTLAWKIPWTEEPGRLQSMGLLRVRHD